MVPASINVDPINPVVSQEADDENQQVSNNSTILETCECYECGKEIGEKDGYLADGGHICDRCAYECRVMEKPSAYYFDEKNEAFDKMAHKEEEEEDVWEELYKIVFPNTQPPQEEYKPISRSYHHDLEYGIPEPVRSVPDPLPGTVEELYALLDKYLETVSIIPEDAILIDSENIYCSTYDQAKETLTRALRKTESTVQDLPDAYIVSQQNGRFWYMLSEVVNDPTTFNVSLYAKKDEVATKYLRRQFDDCIYVMDYFIHPEDYPHDGDDEEEEEESVVVSESVVNEQVIKCVHCENILTDGQEYIDNNLDYCYSCADAVFYQEPVSIVPADAKLVDEYIFHPDCFESYEQAKHALNYAIKHRVVQELPESYVVAYYRYKKNRWWCVLEKDTFKLSLYANKDEVAMKYLRRQMEEVVDRMEMYQDGDSEDESDPGDPDFCDSCAPTNGAKSAPFCCTNHMLCFEKGYGLKWCGGVEPLYHCKVCECEPYYRSQRHEDGYGWYASQSTEKGIRPIDSAICMFEEIGLNTLLFENLVDLCEYF